MDLPRTRSTHQPATLDDLIAQPRMVHKTSTRYFHERGGWPSQIIDEYWEAVEAGQEAATDHLAAPALAAVLEQLDRHRADVAAHDALRDALEPVIRPAVLDATAAGIGTIVAYGPGEEVVARPSVGIPRGQVLLLRTDLTNVDPPFGPIRFEGANS